jgi:prophage antirepressor-like protein
MEDQNPQGAAPHGGALPVELTFDGHVVRTVMTDGELWFVAADVCEVLEIKNPRDAIVSLDDDERGVVSTDTPGGTQEVNAINESGLYRLVFKSRKVEARNFRKWVTHDVLPSIRKTGRYDGNQTDAAPRLNRATREINVALPCPGLFLVSAKESGRHLIEPATDDQLELTCLFLSFDHLCYAVKSINALWTQLRLRLPILDEDPYAHRIKFFDEAINNASRISAHYKADH